MHSKISAGILLYRKRQDELEVFLVHPGGPYWKNKDEGAWSIPKGESSPFPVPGSQFGSEYNVRGAEKKRFTHELFETAKREFFEETSFRVEDCCKGEFIQLKPVKLKSGKVVHAFAVEGDIAAEKIVSNTILIEWPARSHKDRASAGEPPKSKKQLEIPEVDRGEWFAIEEAKKKINVGQVPLVEELVALLTCG